MSQTIPILQAISRHDGGKLVESADELLKQCVRDVTMYGQKAKLTLTIEIKPNGDEGALSILMDAKATLPKRPHSPAFYWATEDNDLVRQPPKEDDLLLRSIPSGAAKA